jgi:hypothetical protein
MRYKLYNKMGLCFNLKVIFNLHLPIKILNINVSLKTILSSFLKSVGLGPDKRKTNALAAGGHTEGAGKKTVPTTVGLK